ncbi:MAG: hypothetical protein IJQ70_02330 [Synergistaceae bacterium]|nr:hypothetical protein [Synergistaceae bacterium]
MAILLAIAGFCALVLSGSVAVLICSHRLLNRAFHVLDFAIRLAEQNSPDIDITRREGSE